MKCPLCETAPSGFEGHPGLGAKLGERPTEGTAFACTICGCEWLRRHAGDGRFEWARWRRELTAQ